MTIDEVLFDAEEKMLKTEDHILNQFAGVRTGKATPSLIENVMVEAYGSNMRLKELATITAPEGWHRLVINAKQGGSSVLVVRFNDLSASRLRNVADALVRRGWQLDEDREGATLRQPPGTSATDTAFEVLAAIAAAGAPSTTRTISAIDTDGTEIGLSS